MSHEQSFFDQGPSILRLPKQGEPPHRVNGMDDPGYWSAIEVAANEDGEPADPQQDEPEEPEEFIASPIGSDELFSVAPREWVYSHFLIRRFISVLGAPGGSGKTAYAYVIALAIVTGTEFLGEKVHEPGNVWIYNLEDPRDELLRRLRAPLAHFNIGYGEIADKLFLDSGRDRSLVIAKVTRDGSLVAEPVVEAVIAEIKRRNIRVLIVDPFVRSHQLEENNNEQINFAAALWGQVAGQADCSVLLVHHFRKGGVSGDAAAFRGASALIDASRAAVSLSPMSDDEAGRLGVDSNAVWQYLRVDNAKLNLAPPPENATWLHLRGIDIDNATASRPSDQVQTVERWEPPSPWADLPMSVVTRILDKLSDGPSEGERYTRKATSSDRSRWAGTLIMEETGKTEKQATAILRAWVENGVLEESQYYSPSQRKDRAGITANATRVSEMRRTFYEKSSE